MQTGKKGRRLTPGKDVGECYGQGVMVKEEERRQSAMVCTCDSYKDKEKGPHLLHAPFSKPSEEAWSPSSPTPLQPGCKVRHQKLGFKGSISALGPPLRPVGTEEPMAILLNSPRRVANNLAPGKLTQKRSGQC